MLPTDARHSQQVLEANEQLRFHGRSDGVQPGSTDYKVLKPGIRAESRGTDRNARSAREIREEGSRRVSRDPTAGDAGKEVEQGTASVSSDPGIRASTCLPAARSRARPPAVQEEN